MSFKVAVKCFTYNHASFIKDAMDGFCMQETGFPYICIIVDDASTDGEQEVIRQYLSAHFELENEGTRNEETDDYRQTFARHKTNPNCFFAVLFLKYNHYGKNLPKAPYLRQWVENVPYLAFCEGDDYWTDPSKLQKQVGFLEKHGEYVICSHDYICFYQQDHRMATRSTYADLWTQGKPEFVEYSLDDYFERWWTHPLTCVYRNCAYLDQMPRHKYENFRDDIYFYYVLREGKGALLPDLMGIYRVHGAGVWSTYDSVQKYQLSFKNAYAIYRNEGDERAITKMDRERFRVVTILFNSHCYGKALKEVLDYWKAVPHKYFFAFASELRGWFLAKIKRHLGFRKG